MSIERAAELVAGVNDIRAELVELVQDLVRIPSENTGVAESGKETRVAEYLKARLESEGIRCEILESPPGRGNLIARMVAEGEEPRQVPILLLSHLDVVPAGSADDWMYPPFSGEVTDGRLY